MCLISAHSVSRAVLAFCRSSSTKSIQGVAEDDIRNIYGSRVIVSIPSPPHPCSHARHVSRSTNYCTSLARPFAGAGGGLACRGACWRQCLQRARDLDCLMGRTARSASRRAWQRRSSRTRRLQCRRARRASSPCKPPCPGVLTQRRLTACIRTGVPAWCAGVVAPPSTRTKEQYSLSPCSCRRETLIPRACIFFFPSLPSNPALPPPLLHRRRARMQD